MWLQRSVGSEATEATEISPWPPRKGCAADKVSKGSAWWSARGKTDPQPNKEDKLDLSSGVSVTEELGPPSLDEVCWC